MSYPPPSGSKASTSYRPVSAWAVTGFGFSLLFALIVFLGIGTALATGQPFVAYGTLLLGVAGLAISLVARGQIRASEGTRAGDGLAIAGFWLALVPGLLYLAYLLGIELAIRSQAREFTDAWWQRLRQGDAYAAFVLTQPPDQRIGDNPRDERRLLARYGLGPRGDKGPLPLFLELDVVRIMLQAGHDAQVEPLGTRRWQYVEGGYLVEQTYRIRTPEALCEVVLPVFGSDSAQARPEYEGRPWHVVLLEPPAFRVLEMTSLGAEMAARRQEAERFAAEWTRKLNQRAWPEAYRDTCEPSRRMPLDQEHAARSLAAVFAASPHSLLAAGLLVHPEARLILFLPGFADFRAGRLLQFDRLLAPDRETENALASASRMLFTGSIPAVWSVPRDGRLRTAPWQRRAAGLQVHVPIELQLNDKFRFEGTVTLRHDDRSASWQILAVDLTFGRPRVP
ncbi:MAG: DUF4190 domain-containing protein [Gemmataceae bacterium]|nr:DUF4190 domain-containing protein [Gemmataceae bacterium]MDW8265922.1 DUF4190 domain-containing protein [Gemmataceae bacterium]